jgi:cell division transport system permease protein
MTGRLRLLFSEAWRSTTANVSTTVAAALTVLAAMFVLGCAIGLVTLLNSYSSQVKKQLVVNVYFCTDLKCPDAKHGYATAKEINNVRRRLESDPRVKSVTFVSKEQAFKAMKKSHPDLVSGVPSNPLPDAEKVTAKKADYIPAIAKSLTRKLPTGVATVTYGATTTKKILDFANLIKILSAIALAILGIASMLLVVNTIRLSIFSRRREIEVMKLVGASNWFVRGPFMIEGLITGFFGAVIAIVLLLLGKIFVLPSIHFLKAPGAHAVPFELNALLLLVFGLLIGVGGSMITIRRFLRV